MSETVLDWGDDDYVGIPSRAFCFTLNNWTAADDAAVKQWKCAYLVFGKEVAPTTGTPHLQGYVYFSSEKTWTAALKFVQKSLGHKRMNLRSANGTADQNRTYCSKEDADFFEKGTKPASQADKGAMESQAWIDAIEHTKNRQTKLIRPDIAVRYHKQLASLVQLLADEERPLPEPLETTRGEVNEWHFGVPNAGKSHYCKYQQNGGVYKPPRNLQYWGGYKFEDNVLINDITEKDIWEYMSILKNLAEEDPVSLEVKNKDEIVIRPKKILVSTQADPRVRMKGVDAEALFTRFKFYEWKLNRNHPDWAPPPGLVIPNPEGSKKRKRDI